MHDPYDNGIDNCTTWGSWGHVQFHIFDIVLKNSGPRGKHMYNFFDISILIEVLAQRPNLVCMTLRTRGFRVVKRIGGWAALESL